MTSSHALAHDLLRWPDQPLVFQVGHDSAEGELLPDVIDLSQNLDQELCLEIGDTRRPEYQS